MDNIVKFPGVELTEVTSEDYDDVGPEVNIDDVLEGAKGNGLQDVILIGRNEEGQLYFASTHGRASQVLYDIESAKYILMSMTFTSLED